MAQIYDPNMSAAPGVTFNAKAARPNSVIITALDGDSQVAIAVASELSAEEATYPGWYVMAAYTEKKFRNSGLITEVIVGVRETLASRGVESVYLLQMGEHDVSKGTAGTIDHVADNPELPKASGATYLYRLTA